MKSAIKRNRKRVLTVLLIIMVVSVNLSGVWAQSTEESSNAVSDNLGEAIDNSLEGSGSKDIVEYVTVTYHPNGGDGNTVVDGPYPAGSTYMISNADALGIRIDDNYKVTYWTENQDGSGNIAYPGDQITLTENLDLYAHWEHQGPLYYMLVLDANTGTGSKVISGLYHSTSYTLEDADAYGIVKLNYEFTGWNSEADGSGIDYGKTNTLVMEKNITVYAQWKFVSIQTHLFVYSPHGGHGETTTENGILSGSEYIVKGPEDVGISMPVPILKFSHWVNKDDPAETFMEGEVIAALDRTIILNAEWKLEL